MQSVVKHRILTYKPTYMERNIAIYLNNVKFIPHCEGEMINEGDLVWERDTHKLYVVKEVNNAEILLRDFKGDSKPYDGKRGLYKLKFALPDIMN